MTDSNKPSTGWLFTIVVVMALFLPRIVTEGMFMDGLTYSAVALQLAQGQGGFWDAHYYDVFEKTTLFQGHPPLQFWLQSLMFRLFDSTHWMIERVYGTLMLIVSILLIRFIWNRLFLTERTSQDLSWLPVLMWYVMPTVFWAYPNNLLEITTTVFTLGSVGCLLYWQPTHTAKSSRPFMNVLALVGFTVLVMCAFLTKGPVGLFPLALPFFMAYQGGFGISYKQAIACIIGFLALFALVLLQDKAFVFFEKYWQIQVQTALSGKAVTESNGVWGRFFLLKALILELLIPMAIVICIYWSTPTHLKNDRKGISSEAKWLLFMALSASLPLLLSTKQRGFYLLPALPWFALALAAICRTFIQHRPALAYASGIRKALWLALAGVLAFTAMESGKIGREKDLLTVLHVMQQRQIGAGDIGICQGALGDYGLHAYIQRYGPWRPEIDSPTADYLLFDTKVCGERYGQNISSNSTVVATAGTWVLLKKN